MRNSSCAKKRKSANAPVGKKRNVSSRRSANASAWNENSASAKNARRGNVSSGRKPRQRKQQAGAVGLEAYEVRARRCGVYVGLREEVCPPVS